MGRRSALGWGGVILVTVALAASCGEDGSATTKAGGAGAGAGGASTSSGSGGSGGSGGVGSGAAGSGGECEGAGGAETPLAASSLSAVWVNNGQDKITQDELRASGNAQAVINSVWDGETIAVFGGKNEVISFNVILEAASGPVDEVRVSFDSLLGPSCDTISSAPAIGDGVFDWTERPIELFYLRYLQIKGLSLLSYGNYDERHVPLRMQRPYSGEGYASGTWQDRPDHDKYYPDIAVPHELVPSFSIAKGSNQSIWADVAIPKSAAVGVHTGVVTVSEAGEDTHRIPVELTVRDFTLPDKPTLGTMVVISQGNINHRYLGEPYPNGAAEQEQSKAIRDKHFQMAHRHRLSLIDGDFSGDQPGAAWLPRLDGSLFTAANGYAGPGVGVGNGVYSIGTYGSWSWKGQGQAAMQSHSDAWVSWFATNAPDTELFLYLIDESSNYAQIQQWASWIENNPGPGSALMSFATIGHLEAVAHTPALDIAASWIAVAETDKWQKAVDKLVDDPTKRSYFYNGIRPASGSFATEDDGVALRALAWGQHKKRIDRWFYWESTYYNNYQAGEGQTNVFQQAATFGGNGGNDPVQGETGWNHSNGDGVLFYPGTDKLFPGEAYAVSGPLASLRLKLWRRGIQDGEYLELAAAKDPDKVKQIVQQMIPKAMWEVGVSDPGDPTWVRADISWSIDPDEWEQARAQLAAIIEG